MKFTAVGDVLIQRGFPGEYEGFSELKEYINKGDFRFCNLETTIHREGECFGSHNCGGSYLRIGPEGIDYIKQYNFNAINCANNHALDFAHNGVLKTLEYLRNEGYVAAGLGENLSSAASPVYIDTVFGRVALIGIATAIDQPDLMAGEQSKRVMGRPGVNGLRAEKRYIINQDDIDVVRRLAKDTKANAKNDVWRKEGYLPQLPENCVDFEDMMFEAGEVAGQKFILNNEDMGRIEKSIFEARLQADYIFVSAHIHEQGAKKEDVPEFMSEFAKQCIDFGADGIIGHGPHLLRGIEIYKGKPIFYSLGDFILQNENSPFAPEDYYSKYGLTSSDTMHELFKNRSNNFTRGLATDKRMFETVIPYWETENGEMTYLELMPVELTFDVPRSRYGMPKLAKNTAIIERLAELSKPYGTKIEIKDGKGIVKL